MDQQNVEVLCQLSKEMEFTVLGMKMMQSQMTKCLQEKENLKESQRTIKDLRGEVFKLNAEMIEKERYYEGRLKELEVKILGNDASLISWNEEKEVTFERPLCSLLKSSPFLKRFCALLATYYLPFQLDSILAYSQYPFFFLAKKLTSSKIILLFCILMLDS